MKTNTLFVKIMWALGTLPVLPAPLLYGAGVVKFNLLGRPYFLEFFRINGNSLLVYSIGSFKLF